MLRRDLLRTLAAVPLLIGANAAPMTRVRPGDPAWLSAAQWEELRQQTGGRLIEVHSPLLACREGADSATCDAVFKGLKNPYYIGDHVGLTQTTGWVDAWTFQPSAYAVAAESPVDIVAAVNFGRQHNLRLVVKGGGHCYLGRSNAPDSLLVWTRHMNSIVLHREFVPAGCEQGTEPQQAVSIGAGAIWGQAYNAVTTAGGRYVQGGGCLTVGVAGLVQAGGFGSFSKHYGSAAASLLEAEIVTADGAVRIANACSNPDLFWALKGGGGGSFGIVTRLTLKTHALPERFGGVHATIYADSEDAFQRLVRRFIAFYADELFNPRWGEIVTLRQNRRMDIRMSFLGLEQQQAEVIWRPFFDWVAASPQDYVFQAPPVIGTVPAASLWDPAYLRSHIPQLIHTDDRPGASADNIFWAGNLSEAGHFIFGYASLWLPASLLQNEVQVALVDILCAASHHAPVELHLQKGLAGAPAEAIAAARDTAMNPKVLDAFALAIVGGEGSPVYPGVAGHEPDLRTARRSAGEVARAIGLLKTLAPEGGCYFAESDFFEGNWQEAYWGANYPRLLEVKRKYDPGGLFFVHHGVGSELWGPPKE